MTLVLPDPRPVFDNGLFFYSEWGLPEFQVQAVLDAYTQERPLIIADTGTGKTIIMLALACELYYQDKIDLVVMIGDKNKIVDKTEFLADWQKFTTLRTFLYHGPARVRQLDKALETGLDVVLTTYETGAMELMRRVKTAKTRGKGHRTDGPLMDRLDLRRKRVLWLFDECSKFANRGSERYQSWYYALDQLRRTGNPMWVVGVTGTVMPTDFVQGFNVGRMIGPHRMSLNITQFEKNYVRGEDIYRRPVYVTGGLDDFAARWFQPMITRIRETDPEVRGQLPKLRQKIMWVDLEPEHRQFYQAVSKLWGEGRLTSIQQGQMAIALKLTAGHPASHLHSDSKLSKTIVETLGEEALRAIPSSKTLALIERLTQLCRIEEKKVLVFSRYANTVLPELMADLREAGFTVAPYTGEQSPVQNRDAKQAFKSGQVDVLLCSDAGNKGLNLPEASYAIEYDSATTVDDRIQRFGRHKRIRLDGTEQGFVYAITMITNRTIEVAEFETVMKRLGHQDVLYGDVGADGHIDAEVLRRQLRSDS